MQQKMMRSSYLGIHEKRIQRKYILYFFDV
jgi:hypothetical protein